MTIADDEAFFLLAARTYLGEESSMKEIVATLEGICQRLYNSEKLITDQYLDPHKSSPSLPIMREFAEAVTALAIEVELMVEKT